MNAESGRTDERWCELSVAVELTGVSGHRLRRLEREGLIQPRHQGAQRQYTVADLQRIRKIRRLTEQLGINLAAAGIILRLTEELETLRWELAQARDGRG